ncbi:hypothetical protein S7335_1820 [Synechococcus sp. PCC 7335]|uniref:hypothetical protein n=1 Tax=Synechococcus sp. (strain ATCC 29403 / PCC 7335) TaxID=91464 RepID=UPI00017ED229|nr:hypothetical protein [Synechococcus sp. PCC 7335]EDX84123.1 hypothetical protein S7335_1820 [Synechococcus sp. PCC 7335]
MRFTKTAKQALIGLLTALGATTTTTNAAEAYPAISSYAFNGDYYITSQEEYKATKHMVVLNDSDGYLIVRDPVHYAEITPDIRLRTGDLVNVIHYYGRWAVVEFRLANGRYFRGVVTAQYLFDV